VGTERVDVALQLVSCSGNPGCRLVRTEVCFAVCPFSPDMNIGLNVQADGAFGHQD
jgi:hypothetical protein